MLRFLRRLFRRGEGGPRKPAANVQALAHTLSEAGLPAAPAPAEAPEHALAMQLNARSHGLLACGGGPPDLVLVSGASQKGHLAQARITGFHWLIRRDGLAESWPRGAVEAKREFRASDVGPARRFRWTPSDDSRESIAAAGRLNALGPANDEILALLRDPGTLVIELAPVVDLGLIRLTQYVGNRDVLDRSDVTHTLRFCRQLVGAIDASSAPHGDDEPGNAPDELT